MDLLPSPVASRAHDFFIAAAIMAWLAIHLPRATTNGAVYCFESAACFAGHTILPFAPFY